MKMFPDRRVDPFRCVPLDSRHLSSQLKKKENSPQRGMHTP